MLRDEERDQLQRWARRRKSAQALALRSRIVLGCADGLDNNQVAQCWGANFDAQVGDGSLTDTGSPAVVQGL